MTPEALLQRLRHLADAAWPAAPEPHTLLLLAEAACERDPSDVELAEAAWQAQLYASAELGLGPVLAGVHRDQLVRFDALSVTFTGVRRATGQAAMVRAPRTGPHQAFARRALHRDAKALADAVPGLIVDDASGALVAPLAGLPRWQDEPEDEPLSPRALSRLLTTGLESLVAYEQRGLCLPDLSAHEWRDSEHGLSLVCLSPALVGDLAPAIHQLAALLGPAEDLEDTDLRGLLAGLLDLPPRRASDALRLTHRALATDLASHRHALAAQRARTAHLNRASRLQATLQRLIYTLPVPVGHGAVGVDLDGNLTQVISDGMSLRFGPADAPATLWTRNNGFSDPALARRFLRARAAAPAGEALQRRVSGSAADVERISRWTAAALRLRTLDLLLEKSNP